MNRLRGVPLVMMALGALFFGAALSLGTNATVEAAPEDDIRAALQTAVDAWNAGDVDTFIDQFTDNGLMEEFEFTSRAEAEEILPEFIGSEPIELLSVENIGVSGGTARATVELAFGGVIERSNDTLVLGQDGKWRLDSSIVRPVSIPAGVNAIPIQLQEYAFVYDESAIRSGNIAFQVANVGQEPHELALVKINVDAPLAELLESEEEPEGVQFIGGVFFEPGEDGTMVFTEPLANGRYAMLCFVPAPDGTPHAFLGMVSEFNIGAAPAPAPGGGGGTISPPDTGDAGLQVAGLPAQGVLLGAGLAFLAAGLAGLSVVRTRA